MAVPLLRVWPARAPLVVLQRRHCGLESPPGAAWNDSSAVLGSVCLAGLIPIAFKLRLIGFSLVVLLELFEVVLVRVALVFMKVELSRFDDPRCGFVGVSTI